MCDEISKLKLTTFCMYNTNLNETLSINNDFVSHSIVLVLPCKVGHFRLDEAANRKVSMGKYSSAL